ncbi:MAG: ABC transporter substrate-binding protein [Defluviitaleaceae bacterium]|nr:ABC transporter substrate-binding protein [Defluviitaleaceae bacterium]
MKKTKWLSVTALVLAMIIAFAACNGAAPAPAPVDEPTPVEQPADTTPAEDPADDPADDTPAPAGREVPEFTGFPARELMLIAEPDGDVHPLPGNFNPYFIGNVASFGGHQILWGRGLWDVNTMTGETIPTIADGLPTPNADFTEWTVNVREGLAFSDGMPLTAHDVAFTINMIKDNDGLVDSPLFNDLFANVEVISDTQLVLYMNRPFPRITTQLGVNMWGTGFKVVPAHIFAYVDPTSYTFYPPVSVDAFEYVAHDPLGTWILYRRRDDWQNTPTGRAWGQPGPEYIQYRIFGTGEARVMAMINNEVDVMNEVSIEEFQVMQANNPAVRGWYPDFPWANIDDACGKGIMFNTGVAPFDNIDVRWALTLIPDYVEVTMNIFEGVGRMSPFPIPALNIHMDNYLRDFVQWLEHDFTIADGYNPWNPNFTQEVAAAVAAEFGHDFSGMSQAQLEDIFGLGYWRTDTDKATQLLEGAGFTNQGGVWHLPDGSPWVIDVILHPEEGSMHAHRSARVIADQWSRFGIQTDITVLHGADIGTRVDHGDFHTVSSWPWCARYGLDFFQNIQGWNDEVFSFEIGERATGISAYRLPQSDPELSGRITEVIRRLEVMSPEDPAIRDTHMEFLRLATEAHLGIQVHAGIKMVPVNTTYWTGFPTVENPYEGPWWWWSLFRGITTNLTPQ